MEDTDKSRRREKIRDYIDASSKSTTAGVIYALVFGPFGCLYTAPQTALIALFAALAVGLIYWPLIGLVWLGCVLVAPYQVRAFNARVRHNARFLVT